MNYSCVFFFKQTNSIQMNRTPRDWALQKRSGSFRRLVKRNWNFLKKSVSCSFYKSSTIHLHKNRLYMYILQWLSGLARRATDSHISSGTVSNPAVVKKKEVSIINKCKNTNHFRKRITWLESWNQVLSSAYIKKIKKNCGFFFFLFFSASANDLYWSPFADHFRQKSGHFVWARRPTAGRLPNIFYTEFLQETFCRWNYRSICRILVTWDVIPALERLYLRNIPAGLLLEECYPRVPDDIKTKLREVIMKSFASLEFTLVF